MFDKIIKFHLSEMEISMFLYGLKEALEAFFKNSSVKVLLELGKMSHGCAMTNCLVIGYLLIDYWRSMLLY